MTKSSTASDGPVRISQIAGRYLVFDQAAVARLRRQQNINGLLVGTTPQQPTQNIFLGLPIEIRPEEAGALVSAGAAFVVDDAAAHRDALLTHSGKQVGTNAYVEALRRQKDVAQRALAEQKAQKAAEAASKHKQSRSKAKPKVKSGDDTVTQSGDGETSIFEGEAPQKRQNTHNVDNAPKNLAVTPTSSEELVCANLFEQHTVSNVPDGPLCRFLQRTGYFMTPGLRFGSQYSVYPGDPLRFHAHFMANEYAWTEPIPSLEIVEGGRLATAVKKAFLIGGKNPDGADGEEDVRTFSIEWAAM